MGLTFLSMMKVVESALLFGDDIPDWAEDRWGNDDDDDDDD